MNFHDQITPLILTFNEEVNVERVLSGLSWAKRIVVVDSFSTDKTVEILKAHPRVDLFQRKFDSHSEQWNYGLKQVCSPWVLSLDSDYVIEEPLIAEMNKTKPDLCHGYLIPFKYCVFGKPLGGAILPSRIALFKKEEAIYVQDGHTQLLKIQGKLNSLNAAILHDDRKPLSRWVQSQIKYAQLEAEKLTSATFQDLNFTDQLRKLIVFAPGAVLIYCLFVKGGILDGWRGWYYAIQRVFAELMLSLYLMESKIRGHHEAK